ncbi:unnamed protein product [marine sediment metagenome]|uniref:Uncharacterized protein n=1 Tax=marine sediment metagenome TaxID=412755 RepID=X1K795_9ZZZZ
MAGYDDGSGDNWASQGTSSGFIDAGNKLVTPGHEFLFFSKGWFLKVVYDFHSIEFLFGNPVPDYPS